MIQPGQVFFITAFNVHPGKGAPYARLMEYARALTRKENITVHILSTLHGIDFAKAKKKAGHNIYILGEEQKGKKTDFQSFLTALSAYIDSCPGEKSVFVYPSIHGYRHEKKLVKMIKDKGINVFSERNELSLGIALNYPFPKNILKKILFLLYYPIFLLNHYLEDSLVSMYDGHIVISTRMKKRLTGRNDNLLLIPILADTEKFKSLSRKVKTSDRVEIGFTGYLTFKKDGLNELIRSVYLLEKEYDITNVTLNLYGSGYHGTVSRINKLIHSLGLDDRVILHGEVNSGQIPDILRSQDILILTRPSNLQTEHGFSTKLAEYMASGTPVLTTAVSDAGVYIRDNFNGFIIPDHKAETAAGRLKTIISGKEYLNEKIGIEAMKTAEEHFNATKYADQISHFLLPNIA